MTAAAAFPSDQELRRELLRLYGGALWQAQEAFAWILSEEAAGTPNTKAGGVNLVRSDAEIAALVASLDRVRALRPLNVPAFDIGAHVLIVPLDRMAARIVELVRSSEEGWVYVARYIDRGEAKTLRCFRDEIVAP